MVMPVPTVNAVAITFPSLATAKLAVAAIDAHFGYPIAGVNQNTDGITLPPLCAATYLPIWQHPTLAKWAIMVPPAQTASVSLVLSQAGIVAANAASLDQTWLGWTPAWPLAADVAAAQAKVGSV